MKTKEESKKVELSTAGGTDTPAMPAVVDRKGEQPAMRTPPIVSPEALRLRGNRCS